MQTLLFLIIGFFIGLLLQKKQKLRSFVDKSTSIMIWILLLLLGISIGSDASIIENIHTIGWKAIILAFGGIFGSIFCSYFVYIKYFKS